MDADIAFNAALGSLNDPENDVAPVMARLSPYGPNGERRRGQLPAVPPEALIAAGIAVAAEGKSMTHENIYNYLRGLPDERKIALHIEPARCRMRRRRPTHTDAQWKKLTRQDYKKRQSWPTVQAVRDGLDRIVKIYTGPKAAHDHPLVAENGAHVGCPDFCPAQLDFQQALDRIIRSTIPKNAPLTGVVSIDGHDYETSARRLSWATKADVDQDSLEIVEGRAEPEVHRPKKKVNRLEDPASRRQPPLSERVPGMTSFHPAFPQRSPVDGRLVHSKDPDARDQWKAAKNGKAAEIVHGYECHYAVNSRRGRGGAIVPPFLLGTLLARGGSHRGDAAVIILRELADATARGALRSINEGLFDKGYSITHEDRFANPVRGLGVSAIIDVHSQQREVPNPLANGALPIAGSFFASCLPASLRSLEPAPRNCSEQDRLKKQKKFDERASYAFRAHGSPRPDGSQQYVGPAYGSEKDKATLICKNWEINGAFLDKDATPSTCPELPWEEVKGRKRLKPPCNCGVSFILRPEDDPFPKIRTRIPWQTTAWFNHYSARGAVESFNSLARHHRTTIVRGYTRVFTRPKNALLLALAGAAQNLLIAKQWFSVTGQPNPLVADDEVIDFVAIRRAIAADRQRAKDARKTRRPRTTSPPRRTRAKPPA